MSNLYNLHDRELLMMKEKLQQKKGTNPPYKRLSNTMDICPLCTSVNTTLFIERAVEWHSYFKQHGSTKSAHL